MPSGVRKDVVDDRFIERWADRYLQIVKDKGERNANAWARAFLNAEDRLRVSAAIALRRGKQ